MATNNYSLQTTKVRQKPILHVEVRVKSDGDNVIIRTDIVRARYLVTIRHFYNITALKPSGLMSGQIREDVTKWLIDNFAILSLGQELHTLGDYIDIIMEIVTCLLIMNRKRSEGTACSSTRVHQSRRVHLWRNRVGGIPLGERGTGRPSVPASCANGIAMPSAESERGGARKERN